MKKAPKGAFFYMLRSAARRAAIRRARAAIICWWGCSVGVMGLGREGPSHSVQSACNGGMGVGLKIKVVAPRTCVVLASHVRASARPFSISSRA